MKIPEQIQRTTECAKRLRESKFPDYHAAKWLERNADSLEQLYRVYEAVIPLTKTGTHQYDLEQKLLKAVRAVEDV